MFGQIWSNSPQFDQTCHGSPAASIPLFLLYRSRFTRFAFVPLGFAFVPLGSALVPLDLAFVSLGFAFVPLALLTQAP